MQRPTHPGAEPARPGHAAAHGGAPDPVARAAQRAIEPLPGGVTAFVGRALKGPLNEAMRIGSFAEFQQVFGGLWQPAPMSYAVEQYFEQGGREAIIVRVGNGGRAPSLSLPAGRGELRLRGVRSGSREYLRASVDHDGVPAGDEQRFNLVLQRLRAPESGLVEEQETHRLVSVEPGSLRGVREALAGSRLMRVEGEVPAVRPERTGGTGGALIGYVAAHADGTDGEAVTDYDLIGDREAGTGLFALLAGPRFDLLCVPPPTRDADLGLATLLVAARVCRAAQALLVVDPPSSWETPAAALELAPGWPFRSEDAVLAFPRLLAHDRLRGRTELFPSCGAAAGLLARASAQAGEARFTDPGRLRGAMQLRCAVEPIGRLLLARLGINSLEGALARPGEAQPWRTLVEEGSARESGRLLAARRLSTWIQACVLEGTRWLAHEPPGVAAFTRARAQVANFLGGLAATGRLATEAGAQGWYVVCDERLHDAAVLAAGERRVLLAWAPLRPGDYHCCLVTHGPAGSSVRAASVNVLAGPGEAFDPGATVFLEQLPA